MKTTIKLLIVCIYLFMTKGSFATNDSISAFEKSLFTLERMIRGEIPIDFEKAVYLSESPYWDDSYTYEQFRKLIDSHVSAISILMNSNDKSASMDFSVKVKSNGRFDMNKLLYDEEEKRNLYKNSLKNWAIFTYLTDTTINNGVLHLPYTYSSADPFGKREWRHSQVINLLGTRDGKGNCFALTSLYKILANRLNSNAWLCTAPQHIYIQHRDEKGGLYNVELATAGHPSDGQLQTLTYSTSDAIRSGIALRSYSEKESIGLVLVNLAKSFERKYGISNSDFALRCANLALELDSLNLSAILLRQQIFDEIVFSSGFDFSMLIDTSFQYSDVLASFNSLQNNTKTLYKLGYRPMPVKMQRLILEGFGASKENYLLYHTDKNAKPFTTIQPMKEEESSYASLSGGVFKEVWGERSEEVFGRFVFDTKLQKITRIETQFYQQRLIDPVAFAYDFGARQYDALTGRWLSRDPLAAQFPSWSPYVGFADNPVYYTDPDGKAVKAANRDAMILMNSIFELFNTTIDGEAATGLQLFGMSNRDPNDALFRTRQSMEDFQGLLDKSGLSKERKAQAKALFAVMRAEDVVEVGLVNQNSNLSTQETNQPSSQSRSTTQTNNPISDNLINNRGTMSNEGIRTELLNQKNSGTLDNNGAFGFFYNNSNTAGVGGTVGILLINSDIVNGTGDATGSFGQPSNIDGGFGASQRAVLNGIVDFSKTKAFKKTIN